MTEINQIALDCQVFAFACRTGRQEIMNFVITVSRGQGGLIATVGLAYEKTVATYPLNGFLTNELASTLLIQYLTENNYKLITN